MINSFTPPSDGSEAPQVATEPLGGALYGHGGSVAGELGGLFTPSFSSLGGAPADRPASPPAIDGDAPTFAQPARRGRGRPLLVAGFAFAALAVASGAVLLRPGPSARSADGFTPALKVQVDAAGSRSAPMAALAYAPAPRLGRAADAGAPPGSPNASPDATSIASTGGPDAGAEAADARETQSRAADELRRSPPFSRSPAASVERRQRMALVAPEPRWLDRLADPDKPPLRSDGPPRGSEPALAEPPFRETAPRVAPAPERRLSEAEAAPPRPRATPAARGAECGPDTDCPSYQAVMAADGKLRRAYAEAVEAGVPQYVLLSLRRDWSDLRAGRAGQPADLVRGYERVAYELWRARQTALQRRESAGGWDDPDRRGDYR